MQMLEHFFEGLRRHRKGLFTCAGVGLLACLAIVFLIPSQLGFALIGPLAFGPWFLACASLAKSRIASYPFIAFAALTLLWPVIYLQP